MGSVTARRCETDGRRETAKGREYPPLQKYREEFVVLKSRVNRLEAEIAGEVVHIEKG